ncbi:MAG: hypothetical protein HFI66_04780 [Lachnospiraceae bacterium]|nr:hypothetical protein [Lachnospiraceae bacterium]
MKRSRDKRLDIALDMPSGLKRKPEGEEYRTETDEVLAWVSSQPELINVLVSRLANGKYIRYDPSTKTWGGAGHDD